MGTLRSTVLAWVMLAWAHRRKLWRNDALPSEVFPAADAALRRALALAPRLPTARFVLPTAHVQPVTVNGGMTMNSWYDIETLGHARMRTGEKAAGIENPDTANRGVLEEEAP